MGKMSANSSKKIIVMISDFFCQTTFRKGILHSNGSMWIRVLTPVHVSALATTVLFDLSNKTRKHNMNIVLEKGAWGEGVSLRISEVVAVGRRSLLWARIELKIGRKRVSHLLLISWKFQDLSFTFLEVMKCFRKKQNCFFCKLYKGKNKIDKLYFREKP